MLKLDLQEVKTGQVILKLSIQLFDRSWPRLFQKRIRFFIVFYYLIFCINSCVNYKNNMYMPVFKLFKQKLW